MNQVRLGRYSFDDEDWDPVSSEAKRFISKLLTYKASKRPSAAEALGDPWITSNTYNKPLDTTVMKNLTNFNVKIFIENFRLKTN